MMSRPIPGLEHDDEHLKLRDELRGVLASSIRERSVTHTAATAVHGFRRWWIAATLAALLAACGGGKKTDTYARGTDVQGQCCEHLSGDARNQCLQGIVRIDDAAVAKTSTNQATYACVVNHFECDAGTGHPTQRSAQAQLECIQDLQ